MAIQLKRLREQRGWTRAELARQASMQAGVVAWIEEGRFLPYDSQLEKLAFALQVEDRQALLKEVGNNE